MSQSRDGRRRAERPRPRPRPARLPGSEEGERAEEGAEPGGVLGPAPPVPQAPLWPLKAGRRQNCWEAPHAVPAPPTSKSGDPQRSAEAAARAEPRGSAVGAGARPRPFPRLPVPAVPPVPAGLGAGTAGPGPACSCRIAAASRPAGPLPSARLRVATPSLARERPRLGADADPVRSAAARAPGLRWAAQDARVSGGSWGHSSPRLTSCQ